MKAIDEDSFTFPGGCSLKIQCSLRDSSKEHRSFLSQQALTKPRGKPEASALHVHGRKMKGRKWKAGRTYGSSVHSGVALHHTPEVEMATRAGLPRLCGTFTECLKVH